MPERMTTKRIPAQQEHVQTQHERTDTNAEIRKMPVAIVVEKESAARVVGKEADKQ